MPNDGVRSSWNGQRPSYRDAPALRSSVRAETSSTKSTASRTRSLESLVYSATAGTLARERLGHLKLGVAPDAVAVGHSRQIVRHPRRNVLRRRPVSSGEVPRQLLGMLHVVLE